LRELGVEVESYFSIHDEEGEVYRFHNSLNTGTAEGHWFHAYTVAELGEMLPDGVYIYKDEDGWNAETQDSIVSFEVAENMADVCALMLIWLIENKHVDVEELKQ
jgi:hypothetical protein